MGGPLKNVLIRRVETNALSAVAHRARGRMLDIGCGEKPYRTLFAPYVSEHVGLEHDVTIHSLGGADVIGSAYEMPFDDASFDTVLCTWVLEHLEEPFMALREARRVLKPGGLAIYEVPLFWHLHEEPRDFFRYTNHGLTHLFETTGFEIETLEALSGFWVTVGQLSVYYIYRFNKGPMRLLPVIPLLGLMIQLLAGILDRIDRAELWAYGYLVVARASTAS